MEAAENNSANNEMEKQNLALKLEQLEINHVESASKQQGNNLFAEVDDYRKECESVAIEHKKEILKLRAIKNDQASKIKMLNTSVQRMQSLLGTRKNVNVKGEQQYLRLNQAYDKIYGKLEHAYKQIDEAHKDAEKYWAFYSGF